jgi:ABC-type nitrate/sulfonate/bicarbonate transport system substrate-binding protein
VYFHLLELIEQYGIEPEIVFTGPSGATITLVMSGQVDVGSHGNGLLGVPEYESGELRIVTFGSEIETMREVSVRGMVVSEETLANRREVLEQFLRGYQRTLDWMYAEDQAVEWFAEQTASSLDEARRVVRENYPKEALAVGPVTGIEVSVQQAIDTERISAPPTAEDMSRLFRTVWISGDS